MQYFVAPSGLDTNAGSQSAPFQTVQHAATVAKPGDVIVLRGGTYRETIKPAADSITFQPAPGETATISGADVLTGWQQSPTNPNVYTLANQPTLGVGNDQIFQNSLAIPEARFPKMGPDISRPIKSRITTIISVSQTQAVFTDSAIVQADGSWVGASIHLMAGEGWVAVGGTVTAHKGSQLTVSYTLPDTDQSFAKLYEWPRVGNSYFLYNSPTAFTAPGEWYYNPATKLLSVWLQPGQTPANTIIEAKRRKCGIDLSGRKNCTVSGLNLFACTVLMDAGSANNTVTGNNGKYISHFMCWSKGWESADDSGFGCMGTNNLIDRNTIWGSAGDGITANGSGHRITNNDIIDVNYAASDGAGIRMPWGNDLHANYNLITNCGRDGIKASNCTASEISFNRIHAVMLQTTDGGAFYTHGTDGKGTTIHHNEVTGSHGGGFGGAGFYLDNDCSNYSVHHNVAWDCDHAFKHNHNNTNSTLDKNTLIGTRYAINADQATGFSGFVYSSNIVSGPSVMYGAEGRQTNNVGPAANAFNGVSPAGVGAYADGMFDTGPLPVASAVAVPPPIESSTTPPVVPLPASTMTSTKSNIPIAGLTYSDASPGFKAASAKPTDVKALGSCNNGMWAKYAAIDFAAAGSTFNVSMATDQWAVTAGVSIELHLDSVTGPLIGTLKPVATGKDNNTSWYSYVDQSIAVRGATGVRDLYLVFRGNSVGNVRYFWFS